MLKPRLGAAAAAGSAAPAPFQRRGATDIERRKDSHIRVCLDEEVDLSPQVGNPWDTLRLSHRALPDVDRDAVYTSVVFLGKRLELPLLIGSMTGGTGEARRIKRRHVLDPNRGPAQLRRRDPGRWGAVRQLGPLERRESS